MQKLTSILILSVVYLGCNSQDGINRIDDPKYTSYVLKLPSPKNKFSLFSYYVKYPQAHYGFTRFTIQADSAKFKPSSDFFSFSDTLYGYNILGWSGDTIKTLCITSDQNPPQKLLPYKVEVKKWKDWYWQIDYYQANAFYGNTNKYFDSLIYSNDKLVFIGKDTSLGEIETYRMEVVKGQVRIPLGDTIIIVSRLESLTTIDPKYNGGNPIRKPPLVSISSYTLKPKDKIDWNRLKNFGVFVEQEYPK